MNWRGIWHLGSRYLRRKRIKTALLVAAFTLVWLLPAVVALVVSIAEKQLRLRAESTPLVVGGAGSPLELTFSALYFSRPDIPTFKLREIDTPGEGMSVIPLYARYSVQDDPIVGTTVDYFQFRNIQIPKGRCFVRMGECVVGAKVAKRGGLSVGDSVVSSPGSIFDIAGVYPLKMKICGIAEQTGTPDDNAIFVDLKTTWIIEGLGHGHDDASGLDEDSKIKDPKDDDGETIKLNASVMNYKEVTAENASSFHFHGDSRDFPISAAIAIPAYPKAQAFFKDKFYSRNDMQVVTPIDEMDELFDTVFRIQKVVTGILELIGIATLAIGFLVFSLSYRLRIKEFKHLSNMGADPALLRCLIAFEALFVLGASLLLAGVLLAGISWQAPVVVRAVLG